VFGVVLDNAFTHLIRQVEPRKIGIAPFQFGDDAIGLLLVVVAAVISHQLVQGPFAPVAERRMAQVVAQADRLGQVFVAGQCAGQRAPELRHLDRVGEPVAVVIAFVVDEDLRLVLEAAKGGRVNDPIAVPLIDGAIRVFGARIGPAAAVATAHRIVGQIPTFPLLQCLSRYGHCLPPSDGKRRLQARRSAAIAS